MTKIKNLRDVGLGINEILVESMLRQCALYRSGALPDSLQKGDLPWVETVISLRREADPELENIKQLQVAPNGSMNNYVFTAQVFEEWIQRLYRTLAEFTVWPVLLHCTGGKDRTGVGVALVLRNLGISEDAIVEEYMRGEGTRYPESMENLLKELPRLSHLRMDEQQKETIGSELLAD